VEFRGLSDQLVAFASGDGRADFDYGTWGQV